MAEFLRGSDVTLLAYTLMPNHFHMLVQQLVSYGISKYVKNVCDGYAKFINKFRRRSGHLFQGRYKANEARDTEGVLHLSHYIHYNAVSAGLVGDPAEWKYSSYKDYEGPSPAGFVDIDVITRLVGGTENYLELLREYDPSDPAGLTKYLIGENVSLSLDGLNK
jgi:putative transposase